MSLDLAYSVNWVLRNNKTRPRTISRSGDKGEDPLALLVRVFVTQFKLSLAVLTSLRASSPIWASEALARRLCFN